jgi:hypothetical protein
MGSGSTWPYFNIIAKYEKEIPEKYWMNIPPEEQLNYMKMMREARISLTKAGIYDPKMMNFLKKCVVSKTQIVLNAPLMMNKA